MKNILFSIGLLVLIISCSQQSETIKISGKYDSPQAEALVKIEYILNNEISVIDSFYIDSDNLFERNITVNEPGFYRLNFYGRDIINMILDADERSIQLIQKDRGRTKEYRISGSKNTDYVYQLSDLKFTFEESMQSLNEDFMKARKSGDPALVEDIRTRYFVAKKESDDRIKSIIWNMDGSISGILSTSFIDEENEFSFLDSLANKYNRELPESPYTQEFVARIDGMRKLAIGSPAPEIDLPSPEGSNIALSTLRGKYVMIDFWAAWCGPCRRENPNVVRLYQEYSPKGFEVFGVSLDKSKEPWLKAIADDGLTWTHVSDLKHFSSVAAETYQIQGIPATYLIDPNGIIIAKNLRGKALADKLKEIFG